MPIFWHFSTGGGVKSDEDDHVSICAVSGVLTPPREEERKKEPFDSVGWNSILAFTTRNSHGGKTQEKVVQRPNHNSQLRIKLGSYHFRAPVKIILTKKYSEGPFQKTHLLWMLRVSPTFSFLSPLSACHNVPKS